MIRRLKLRNWRSYEVAEVPFEPGTTFIVSPNGIGKTSLLEAARFALTGKCDDLTSPVRMGEKEAEISLSIQLPNSRVLVVERTLTAQSGQPSSFRARIADDELSEERIRAELRGAFGADPAFLGRNAFMLDSLQHGPTLDLRSQLTIAFGLSETESTADLLRQLADEREKEAGKQSRAIRAQRGEIKKLELDHAAAREAAAAAHRRLEATRTRFDEISDSHQRANEHSAAVARHAAWQAASVEIADSLAARSPQVTVEDIHASAAQMLSDAESRRADLEAQAAHLQARIELIEAALSDLMSATAECPVCLRQLGEPERVSARARHQASLDQLRDERRSLQLAQAATDSDAAKQLMRRVDALGEPPSVPAVPHGDSPQEFGELHEAARNELEDAVAEHEAVQHRVEQLAAALGEAKDLDERAAQSVRSWRRWALTSAASTATRSTLDDALAAQLRPTAEAVGEKWNALFADRPDLHFDIAGDMWRDLRGHQLNIDAFSAGERIAARLLMRLAILTTTTRAQFCWVDEPLEHLDPRARRLVARMLSDGRKAMRLRQLVVTTYEEDLAQLLADDNEETHIARVRAPA
ncbi:AAA family ATPase [Candidatus Poriferisodalis sp.]|uniref:AAA family ATPase n=1 Tax=Candidatus Poriferisodalis sp. TaxID=3101277 RepID=UPI003B52F3B5